MKTIVELLKHPTGFVEVRTGDTKLVWEVGALFGVDAGWVVYHRKRGAFKALPILITDEEEKAVRQFAKTAGIESEG
jgi:hypothetical protein